MGLWSSLRPATSSSSTSQPPAFIVTDDEMKATDPSEMLDGTVTNLPPTPPQPYHNRADDEMAADDRSDVVDGNVTSAPSTPPLHDEDEEDARKMPGREDTKECGPADATNRVLRGDCPTVHSTPLTHGSVNTFNKASGWDSPNKKTIANALPTMPSTPEGSVQSFDVVGWNSPDKEAIAHARARMIFTADNETLPTVPSTPQGSIQSFDVVSWNSPDKEAIAHGRAQSSNKAQGMTTDEVGLMTGHEDTEKDAPAELATQEGLLLGDVTLSQTEFVPLITFDDDWSRPDNNARRALFPADDEPPKSNKTNDATINKPLPPPSNPPSTDTPKDTELTGINNIVRRASAFTKAFGRKAMKMISKKDHDVEALQKEVKGRSSRRLSSRGTRRYYGDAAKREKTKDQAKKLAHQLKRFSFFSKTRTDEKETSEMTPAQKETTSETTTPAPPQRTSQSRKKKQARAAPAEILPLRRNPARRAKNEVQYTTAEHASPKRKRWSLKKGQKKGRRK